MLPRPPAGMRWARREETASDLEDSGYVLEKIPADDPFPEELIVDYTRLHEPTEES